MAPTSSGLEQGYIGPPMSGTVTPVWARKRSCAVFIENSACKRPKIAKGSYDGHWVGAFCSFGYFACALVESGGATNHFAWTRATTSPAASVRIDSTTTSIGAAGRGASFTRHSTTITPRAFLRYSVASWGTMARVPGG